MGRQAIAEYFRLLNSGESPAEVQIAIDLLTTNETYFFREPQHFEFLGKPSWRRTCSAQQPLRVWSAAGSTGEEAYSIAMLLEDRFRGGPGRSWHPTSAPGCWTGARRHYPMERTATFRRGYLQRFCLKGAGEQEGTLLVDRNLRSKVRFLQINLNDALPHRDVRFRLPAQRAHLLQPRRPSARWWRARCPILKPAVGCSSAIPRTLNGISRCREAGSRRAIYRKL